MAPLCLCVPATSQQASAQLPDAPGTALLQQSAPVAGPGASVQGVVKDRTGALVSGARVTLTAGTPPLQQVVLTGPDGSFEFYGLPAGPFRITATHSGFQDTSAAGDLQEGEAITGENITLSLLSTSSSVNVIATRTEVAAAEVHLQEKQRVFGIFPNFYVSYVPQPVPLTPRQKFQLAMRSSVDPVTIGFAAALAGIGQADNDLSGYHQGVEGYAKRFGAQYADTVSGTILGGAFFPTLFHQDPRYFWKGSGPVPKRISWAVKQVLICRGDNSHWQPNYSSFAGNLAAAGLSNLYYPETDRQGLGLTLQNFATGYAWGAAGNLIQEFFLRRVTPKVPNYAAANKQ